jgi:hypothetical protein
MDRKNLINRLVARKLQPAGNGKNLCFCHGATTRRTLCFCHAAPGRKALCWAAAQPKK